MVSVDQFIAPRITPIYMGSTSRSAFTASTSWDHPHIHGEHFCSWSGRFRCVGSPPYTWGALLNRLYALFMDRITPIYMGSTGSGAICRSMAWDHPHIHGEHPEINRKYNGALGSPPYTWGAPIASNQIDSFNWITPIYMGSTKTPVAKGW